MNWHWTESIKIEADIRRRHDVTTTRIYYWFVPFTGTDPTTLFAGHYTYEHRQHSMFYVHVHVHTDNCGVQQTDKANDIRGTLQLLLCQFMWPKYVMRDSYRSDTAIGWWRSTDIRKCGTIATTNELHPFKSNNGVGHGFIEIEMFNLSRDRRLDVLLSEVLQCNRTVNLIIAVEWKRSQNT